MSNSCKWVPDAPNGKPSKLFLEVQAKTGNRNIAKNVWAFTQTKMFQSEFSDLEKDDNGDFTYESVAKVLNLDALFNEDEQDRNKAMDMGILKSNGEPKEFDLAETAMDKAASFNKEAKHRVAIVRETEDGKFVADIVVNSAINVAEADKDQARSKLNTRLIRLVQKLGLNVEFVNDPSFQSIFNPKNAGDTAALLSTIIKVSKAERGLEDLPEETSHLVIAGLKGHALMQRADAAFTDEVVKRILGDSYQKYYNKYKNGRMPVEERLREEAQAKVLADILKGRETPGMSKQSSQRNLLQRAWDYFLSLFKKADTSDIDNAIAEAQTAMGTIADEMQRDDFDTVLDRELILKHEHMYDLIDKTEQLAQLAQMGETTMSKWLSILESTNANIDMTKLRTRVKNIRKSINDEKYEAACYATLRAIGAELKPLLQEADRLGHVYNTSTDLNVIAAEAGLVYRMTTSLEGYIPYLKNLTRLPYMIKKGEIEMAPIWAEPITALAREYLDQIEDLKTEVGQLRFSVLKQLICLYYGNNGEMPSTFVETDKIKWESADMILRRAKEDIKFWDTSVFSAGDSKNPLINVLHSMVVRQKAKRDNIINKYTAQMQEAEANLHAAGYENKFVYQYDEKGKPTGFYVAPVDMARFYKDLQAFTDSVNANEDLSEYEKSKLIEEWKDAHMEEKEVTYGNPIDKSGTRRTEWFPRAYAADGSIMYAVPNFQEGWSQEQKDYYKALLDMKANMDSVLPPATGPELYSPPQVIKSVTQSFDKDGHGAIKTMWRKWKKDFSVTRDNAEYSAEGEENPEEKSLYVETNFRGKEIKRVPVYYIRHLEDPQDLSTDATHAMFNYITMAINYSEMGKLADAMRLLQDHVIEEYEVTQKRGRYTLRDFFRAAGRGYDQPLVATGSETRTVQAILKYIDRNFWNETKNVIGEVKHPFREDKSISLDAIANAFLKLVSISRMGLNPLSGMTNVLQGETQILIECPADRYFNKNDFLWAKKEYHALLLDYMGQFNSIDRHDKMYMLINQFNSSEDFFRDMRDKDFNKSALKRVMGRGNIYFLNTMGEHYLHTMGSLMILKHEKVRRLSDKTKKEVSLYDVIKRVHDKNGWHLELDDDIEFIDGNRGFLMGNGINGKTIIKKEDRDALFENLSVYINNVNAGMHGGYSEAEKGNINQKMFGRAILQFRQWMFGMYNKLYSRQYYDAVMNVTKDGSYRTVTRFLVGLLHDMKNMTLKEAIEKNRMTQEEKQNARIAYAQASLYLGLAIACMLTAGWKDKDDRVLRLMAYNLRRLKLETGALSIVSPVGFAKNIITLVQSPAAGVKTLENLTQIFDLMTITQVVHSGRFKGWWKPAKAIWVSTPLYNIQKLIDMDDYSYMFNIFN